MQGWKVRVVTVAALAGGAAAPAEAGEPEVTSSDPEPGDPSEPLEGPARPATDEEGAGRGALQLPRVELLLGEGELLLAGGTVNVNLSADAIGQPASLAPSLWYGVNERLTVGLTHDLGATPWTPRPASGSGVCFTGEENGCGALYDNAGVDALYGLRRGRLALAAHPALDARALDPLRLSLRVGVLGRLEVTERIALAFDPRLAIGFTERDDQIVGGIVVAGNKEAIDLPVWGWYLVNPQLALYAHTGLAGPLDGFGDAYQIPLQLGGSFRINPQLTAGLDLRFPNAFGKDGTGDWRELGFRAAFAL